MAYALYSTVTGQIFNVLYQKPSNTAQLAAITAQGMAFASVPNGIGPNNSMIDLNTGQPLPVGPNVTFYYRYEFNPDGFIFHTGNGNVPDGDPQLTQKNMILSPTELPLVGGMVLTLDKNGRPTKDGRGNYIATTPETPPPPPDLGVLLLLSAVNSGTLDAALIPAQMLSNVNASLVGAGGQEIAVKTAASLTP